jgi:hypothetical protein
LPSYKRLQGQELPSHECDFFVKSSAGLLQDDPFPDQRGISQKCSSSQQNCKKKMLDEQLRTSL